MPFLLLCLLLISGSLSAQPAADTLYYDGNWNLTEPAEALFYRTARVDRDSLVFDGPVRDYLKESHRLLMEGTYRHGKKEGTFTFYHFNGQVANSGQYTNNKPTGPWNHYFPDGTPKKIMEFTGKKVMPYLLQAQWDSTGKQVVQDGKGYWRDFERDLATNKTVVIRGRVQRGRPDGEWVLEYVGGPTLYEEFYKDGRFSFGDAYEGTRKVPYYQSRLQEAESGEIVRPEYFVYDRERFDRDYYGQGLKYFLALYLKMGFGPEFAGAVPLGYNVSHQKGNLCKKGDFRAADFSGGPLALYRFFRKQRTAPAPAGTGSILLNLTINENGKVRDCYVIRGGDIPGKQKAVELMKNTLWVPASCNFTPIKSYLRVLVE